MKNLFRLLVASVAAALLGLASLPAQALAAVPNPPACLLFEFNCNCDDCAAASATPNGPYPVSGASLLQGDCQLGDLIDLGNFVSFTYHGSNLMDATQILNQNAAAVGGAMPADLPGEAQFHVSSTDGHHFTTFVGDGWFTGPPNVVADQGLAFSRNAANGVPEPASLLLFGAALARAGMTRRRRT